MEDNKEFGVAIKAIRVAANETRHNVADAIEITLNDLKKIENGDVLPTENILEMFISHFSLRDSEALRLWELAGYSFKEELAMAFDDNSSNKNQPKELNIHVPHDMKILYTDMMHVSGNKYGIVINYIQGIGPTGKPTVVSRVGMSKEHAKSMLDVLKTSLENSDKADK
jgi:DNA-binding XRE family transcriptional regulator